MGTELARRLLTEQDGIELTVWNRTAERAQPLVEEGAELAASPTEACALAFHAEARAFRKTAAFRFGPPTSTVAASFSPLASRSRSWTYWRGGDG